MPKPWLKLKPGGLPHLGKCLSHRVCLRLGTLSSFACYCKSSCLLLESTSFSSHLLFRWWNTLLAVLIKPFLWPAVQLLGWVKQPLQAQLQKSIKKTKKKGRQGRDITHDIWPCHLWVRAAGPGFFKNIGFIGDASDEVAISPWGEPSQPILAIPHKRPTVRRKASESVSKFRTSDLKTDPLGGTPTGVNMGSIWVQSGFNMVQWWFSRRQETVWHAISWPTHRPNRAQ